MSDTSMHEKPSDEQTVTPTNKRR